MLNLQLNHDFWQQILEQTKVAGNEHLVKNLNAELLTKFWQYHVYQNLDTLKKQQVVNVNYFVVLEKSILGLQLSIPHAKFKVLMPHQVNVWEHKVKTSLEEVVKQQVLGEVKQQALTKALARQFLREKYINALLPRLWEHGIDSTWIKEFYAWHVGDKDTNLFLSSIESEQELEITSLLPKIILDPYRIYKAQVINLDLENNLAFVKLQLGALAENVAQANQIAILKLSDCFEAYANNKKAYKSIKDLISNKQHLNVRLKSLAYADKYARVTLAEPKDFAQSPLAQLELLNNNLWDKNSSDEQVVNLDKITNVCRNLDLEFLFKYLLGEAAYTYYLWQTQSNLNVSNVPVAQAELLTPLTTWQSGVLDKVINFAGNPISLKSLKDKFVISGIGTKTKDSLLVSGNNFEKKEAAYKFLGTSISSKWGINLDLDYVYLGVTIDINAGQAKTSDLLNAINEDELYKRYNLQNSKREICKYINGNMDYRLAINLLALPLVFNTIKQLKLVGQILVDFLPLAKKSATVFNNELALLAKEYGLEADIVLQSSNPKNYLTSNAILELAKEREYIPLAYQLTESSNNQEQDNIYSQWLNFRDFMLDLIKQQAIKVSKKSKSSFYQNFSTYAISDEQNHLQENTPLNNWLKSKNAKEVIDINKNLEQEVYKAEGLDWQLITQAIVEEYSTYYHKYELALINALAKLPAYETRQQYLSAYS
ncbi:hypothetical protein, partial [Psittacicella hinzii]